MCKICRPILGPYTKPHTDAECPLSQASYCSRCGTNRHFRGQCTFMPKPIAFTQQAIPSVHAEPIQKSYAMANTNEAYIEYCRLFALPVQGTMDLNKQTVVAHLETRGFLIEPLPTPPAVPKRKHMLVRKSAA